MNEKSAIVHSHKDHLEAREAKKLSKPDCQIWEEIVERNLRLYDLINGSRRREISVQHDELQFLNQKVFPLLLQCLSEVLEKTKALNSFYTQRLTYNGIDYLSELLYNCNSRHPLRKKKRLLKIPFVKKWLDAHPWNRYGSGVGWSENMAAIVIQAHIRGFLVRSRSDVQEMRTFWKVLKHEKEIADNKNGETQ